MHQPHIPKFYRKVEVWFADSRFSVWQYPFIRWLLKNWGVPLLFPIVATLPVLTQASSLSDLVSRHLSNTSILFIDILSAILLCTAAVKTVNQRISTQRAKSLMFQKIVNRLPTSVAVFDAQHRYVYVNPALEPNKELRKQILGKDDFEYLTLQGKDLNLALERRKRFLNAVDIKDTVDWIDSSESSLNRPHHTLKRYKPIFDASGKLNMVLAVDSDVTDLVEMQEKNKGFKANLRYAKNIQNAILPNLNKSWEFGELFIYHQPKDVVSGDFYWHRKKTDTHYFAVADCTGHGVSGALLTIICHQALNRCLDEFDLKSPASILNKCRELILSMLKNGGNTIADGMDIALCAFHKNTLLFSGANRPLWLLRDGSIQEINGDRYPIGRYTSILEPFNETHIQLRENDVLYLFTDGITDQFGGPNDKKFSKKRLRPLAIEIGHLPLVQQRARLVRTVQSWMGDKEQLDDICFLGIKYNSKVENYVG